MLQEPPKAAQLAFLKGAPAPPRRAHCVVQVPLPGAGYVYEADVLLSSSPAQVVGWRKVRRSPRSRQSTGCARGALILYAADVSPTHRGMDQTTEDGSVFLICFVGTWQQTRC